MVERLARALSLATTLLLLNDTLPAHSAGPNRRLCVSNCKGNKRACVETFRLARQAVVASECTDANRRPCVKAARQIFRAKKAECKQSYRHECRPCCKASGEACEIHVCSDGIASAREECDPRAEESTCSSGFACNGSCRCVPSIIRLPCGNGVLDPGEECDPQSDAVSCPEGEFCTARLCTCTDYPVVE